MSTAEKDGKRGMRVYPPWDTDLNKQATKTQQWQVAYFVDGGDVEQVMKLYN